MPVTKLYYVASVQGFLCRSGVTQEWYWSCNVKYAEPFNSWMDADNYAKVIGTKQYAILSN